MARIVMAGGGIVGLSLAMMLAADGHEVTCLERDPAPPPADPEEAWAGWERRGVNQFRLLHTFLPPFHQVMAAELPGVAARIEADGALKLNVLRSVPEEFTGGWREGDQRFSLVTARRPVMERAVAACAGSARGVTVRRGVAVAGVLTSTPAVDGAVHVTGLRTEAGEEVDADLVIDAGGRRSPLPAWLASAGARPVPEECDDSGFMYYGRYFRSADGSLPPALGSPLQEHGSISSLTLVADHGTWGVGLVTRVDDKDLRGLRSPSTFERVVRAIPTIAHWHDGVPLDDEVAVMAKVEDRIRHLRDGSGAVVTGLVSVGDAWSCTNPSVGRGTSIGLLHASVLRDCLRQTGLERPGRLEEAFAAATSETVEPWFRSTVEFDRGRLAEMAPGGRGAAEGGAFTDTQKLQAAMYKDPDCFRAFLDVALAIARPEEVIDRPGIREKAEALGGGWREEPYLGPSRSELVALVQG